MSESLRELVVALSLDSDNFSRNLRTINQQIKEAESVFRLAGSGVDNFEKTIGGAEAKLSMLAGKLKEQNRAVEQYSRALVAANQKLTDSAERQEKMKASLADARTEMDRLKVETGNAAREYRRLSSTLGENDSATIAAKQNLENYKDEYKAARDQVKLLEGQLKANGKTIQNNADAVSKVTTNLNNAKATVRETEAQIRKTTTELYKLNSGWIKAGTALTNFSKHCATVEKALTKVGKGMTAALTTPIVALGTTAIKASIDYEDAFTSVRKTVDATEEEFASLSSSIMEMSTQVASSAGDIAEVMSVAGQLGIQNDHLVDFTRTMIDLGNSTDIVADQAASTLAKFANIMDMDQSLFQNLGSALVDLGNNYATTESAIMEMSMRLAGAGHQVGLSESQILGFATALSSVGIEAQMGGSAFSKALVKMEVASATGGQALEDFAKVSGMTAKEFKALWDADPAAAFQAFIVGLSKLDESGESAIVTLEEIGIKEVRLRDTMLRATNATELFSKAQVTANEAWKKNTALTEEANKRYATTKSKLTNLKNTAMLFAQQIGDDLNPTIQALIEKANELLAAFLGMDETQRMAIIKFAGIAAAVGPAILILGKMVGAVGQVTSVLGKISTGISSFGAAVQAAGGGLGGFVSTVLSSKVAVAALAAALIYGAYKFADYASGAKAVREAMESMHETAEKWKNTAAETFYGNSSGLSFFGMSEADFTNSNKSAEDWMAGLLAVWSDGKKETNEIVKEWSGSFKSLTASTRDELTALQEAANSSGYTNLSDQLATDIQTLNQMDSEIDKLLKKRQNQNLTDEDKIKLQQLIDDRHALEIKYNLVPADAEGFETITQKVEAEIARAQAKGKTDADVTVYENAVVAAAKGLAAVNAEIDAEYDKQLALISLIEDSTERQSAMEALNAQYNADRLAAAKQYAETLAGVIMPVWNQPDIQEAGADIDTLTTKLAQFSAASESDKPKLLTDLSEFVAGMDEGAVTEYIALLTQVQSLMDSGMSEADISAMFPELDFSASLDQIAAIQQFLQGRETLLPDLTSMFGTALSEEVLKIATDLDMTGAQARWAEFASKPGAITTEAIISGYVDAEGMEKAQLTVDALISSYTEVPEGASTASLTPTGILAYVEKYAEVVTGADVSGLNPENITAMVAAYNELATGADISTLKPDEVTAYIAEYLETQGVDTSGLTPEAMTAFVLAYEEVTGGALTTSLTPTDIAATVTEYLEAKGVDLSKLTGAQIDAIVNSYAEATNCDKTALKAEVIAHITAYEEAEGVNKPSFISTQVSITGYDLTAYRQLIAKNPIEVEGIVRLGSAYENPADVLQDENTKFWQNGLEIPVSAVTSDMLTAEKVAVLDGDGTLHILLTPELSGSPEVITQLREEIEQVDQLGVTNAGRAFGLLPKTTMDLVDSALSRIQSYQKTLDYNAWDKFWASVRGESTSKSTLDTSMQLDFNPDTLANMSAYVSELVTAIKNGDEISQEDYANLQQMVTFLNGLETAGVGENITAGIGEALVAADWNTDAESVASNLENALNAAFVIQSPSERMKPVGEYAAAGVGAGMAEYDLAADVATLATNVTTAMNTALPADALTSLGTAAAQGLGTAISSYDISSAASGLGSSAKTAVSTQMPPSSFTTIGLQAMNGLKLGIQSGQAGVVSAIRTAARAAVAAAKNELVIKSPSRVFRDEVGRMTMKGFGQGVILEAKAQAKAIQNASRYLTDEAKAGSISTTSNDNRRTYNQSSSVNLSGNTFYVRDEQDIRSLAVEIATLTRTQQRGKGLRMA